MNHELTAMVQNAASGKAAFVTAAASASTPWWISTVQSEGVQAAIMLAGLVVSVTIIAVNVQTLRQRCSTYADEREMNAMRKTLIRRQLTEQA